MKSTNLDTLKPDIQLVVFDYGDTLDDDIRSIPLLEAGQDAHDRFGIKTILATDQTKEDAEKFTAALSKKGYNFIDDYVCFSTFWCGKDHEKFWPSLMKKFQVTAANIAFVDNFASNVMTAKLKGVHAILAMDKTWAASELRTIITKPYSL